MEAQPFKVREIVSKVVDNRGRNADYYDFEKYPVIDNYMIKNELHPDLSTATRFLSEEQFQSFLRGYINEDDLLMTLVGGIGNVSLAPHSVCAIVQNTIGLSFKTEKCDSYYAYYYFKTIQDAIRNLNRGITQPSVNREDILGLKIWLPDIKTQKSIATVLKNYDSLIEANNKRIKVLEQMAENLYKEWFVRFRFPGHKTAKFADGVPTSWRKARISDLVSFLNGFAFKSEDYDDAGRYIVVTIKNVQDGYFDLSSVERIDFLPSRMPRYCVLKKGDIIMSLTGNVGRVCIVSSNDCLLNQRVCKIESQYPLFAYSFFKQEAIFQMLCNLAYGTAQLNLSPILTGKMRTILPPDELMKQYNDNVSPLFSVIQSLREQNENLVKQRDLLLPRLMSGKLEVY